MTKETVILTALVLLVAPFATTMAGANADDNATWGLCTADENNEQGDEASNGTIDETPPFANLSEEDCENATAPWEGTPGEDHVPEDTPGPDDNPGDDHPDEDDNPGDEERDNPDEDDNPGDDRDERP